MLSSPFLDLTLLQKVYRFLDLFTLVIIHVIQSLIYKFFLIFTSHLILSRFLLNLKESNHYL